jgi:hypothetical protein
MDGAPPGEEDPRITGTPLSFGHVSLSQSAFMMRLHMSLDFAKLLIQSGFANLSEFRSDSGQLGSNGNITAGMTVIRPEPQSLEFLVC